MEYQPHDDRYTTAQNNAGVHSFITIGNYDQALHHFRQALAAKLTTENRSLQSTPVQQDHRPSFVVEESPSNDDSRVEESHQRCVTPELPEDNTTPINCRNMESRNIENTGYIPYLYLQPFTINKCNTATNMNDVLVVSSITPIDDMQSSIIQNSNNTTLESTRMSLIIIFNVALVYHIMNRSSTKAYYMYKIAMALLLSLPRPNDSTSLLLHTALLNNFGIWCYENNEYDAMTLCFEEIIELFDDIYQDDIDDDDDGLPIVLDMDVKRGIFANLRACLPP